MVKWMNQASKAIEMEKKYSDIFSSVFFHSVLLQKTILSFFFFLINVVKRLYVYIMTHWSG